MSNGAVFITNRSTFETYMENMKTSNAWTFDYYIVWSLNSVMMFSSLDQFLFAIDFIDKDGSPYTCHLRLWNADTTEGITNVINSNDGLDISATVTETLIEASLGIYDADPGDYDTNKYVFNPFSSFEAQAEDRLLVTNNVAKRISQPDASEYDDIVTKEEYDAAYPARKANQIVNLDIWKTNNGWP